MERKRRAVWPWILVAAVAGLILAVMVLASGTHASSGTQSQTLSDGTVISLAAITYGRHAYVEGNSVERALLPALPPALRGIVGGKEFDYTGSPTLGPDVPVVWLRFHRPGGPHQPPFQFSTVDDDGAELRITGGSSWYQSGNSDSIQAYELEPYLKRRPVSRIRLSEWNNSGQLTTVAEFTIPNAHPGSYPQWTPEPLPSAKTDGDLAVTLEQVVTGVAPASPPRRARKGEEPWTECRFGVSENGKASEDWGVAGVVIDDATGNHIVPSSSSSTSGKALERWFGFGGVLPVDEHAYKLRMEMTRTAHFAPSEVWTARNVPLPASGKNRLLTFKGQASGYPIEVVAVVGKNGTNPLLGKPGYGSFGGWGNSPWVLVRAPGLPDGWRFSMQKAVDDLGREVRSGGSSCDKDHACSFALEPKPGAHFVNLTFAVVKSRYVEFVAPVSRLK